MRIRERSTNYFLLHIFDKHPPSVRGRDRARIATKFHNTACACAGVACGEGYLLKTCNIMDSNYIARNH